MRLIDADEFFGFLADNYASDLVCLDNILCDLDCVPTVDAMNDKEELIKKIRDKISETDKLAGAAGYDEGYFVGYSAALSDVLDIIK